MDAIFWSQPVNQWGSMYRYIGPYKIKHWLKKAGYATIVVDFIFKLTAQQLADITFRYITQNTKVIGISTTFLVGTVNATKSGEVLVQKNSLPDHVLEAIKIVKDRYPHIRIALGGYGSTFITDDSLIDDVVMSYTEATEDIFLEYLNHLAKGNPPPPCKLIFSQHRKKAVKHYYAANLKVFNIEVDDFKFAVEDNILFNEPLPLDVSRGCIFACKFCKYPHLGKGKLDYIRGMEYIKEELIYNYENFGTTSYTILDDTFNDTQFKMEEFHKTTESLPFKITYTAYVRVDLVDRFPDTAYLLKESGLFGAFHGLESLHPKASQIIGKGWSGKRGREFVPHLYHDIWKGEVPQLLGMILGLPGEPRESIWDTVDWFESNDLFSMTFNKLYVHDPKTKPTSYPSEFEKNPEKYGIIFDPEVNWRNDFWTDLSAIEEYKKVNQYIIDKKLQKISVWNIPMMKTLGYSTEYLLSTRMNDVDWPDHNIRLRAKYSEYFARHGLEF